MKHIKVLLFFFLCITLYSCSNTKYITKEIPVEVIKTEYINSIKYDSIYVKDSIERLVYNDTVFLNKWHTKYIERVKCDTIINTDSIPVYITNTVTKEVKVNVLKFYQEILIGFGILFLIEWLLRLVYNKLKK